MCASNGSSFYAINVNAGTGVHTLILLNAGSVTTLATTRLSVVSNAWYLLTVAYSSGGEIIVSLNSTQLFSVTEASLLMGSIGVLANTVALFSAISFSIPCFGTCSPSLAQGVCQFICPTGYIQQGTGRQVCTASASGTSASWVGKFLDKLGPSL